MSGSAIPVANDPDADRHGIVTPSAGLMNPNHFLAVAIGYLLTHRPLWPKQAAVGKTLRLSGLPFTVVGTFRERVETFSDRPRGSGIGRRPNA